MLKLIAFHCVNVTIIAPIPIVKFCYYQKKKKKRKNKASPRTYINLQICNISWDNSNYNW